MPGARAVLQVQTTLSILSRVRLSAETRFREVEEGSTLFQDLVRDLKVAFATEGAPVTLFICCRFLTLSWPNQLKFGLKQN